MGRPLSFGASFPDVTKPTDQAFCLPCASPGVAAAVPPPLHTCAPHPHSGTRALPRHPLPLTACPVWALPTAKTRPKMASARSLRTTAPGAWFSRARVACSLLAAGSSPLAAATRAASWPTAPAPSRAAASTPFGTSDPNVEVEPTCVGDFLAFGCSPWGQYLGSDCSAAENGSGIRNASANANACHVGVGGGCRSGPGHRDGDEVRPPSPCVLAKVTRTRPSPPPACQPGKNAGGHDPSSAWFKVRFWNDAVGSALAERARRTASSAVTTLGARAWRRCSAGTFGSSTGSSSR
jgi:hypothetical protein